jgi:hypothetical protein
MWFSLEYKEIDCKKKVAFKLGKKRSMHLRHRRKKPIHRAQWAMIKTVGD